MSWISPSLVIIVEYSVKPWNLIPGWTVLSPIRNMTQPVFSLVLPLYPSSCWSYTGLPSAAPVAKIPSVLRPLLVGFLWGDFTSLISSLVYPRARNKRILKRKARLWDMELIRTNLHRFYIACMSWPQKKYIEEATSMSTDRGMDRYIYTMEYYSAVQRNEIGSFVVMWMNLGSVIKRKTNILTHIYGI